MPKYVATIEFKFDARNIQSASGKVDDAVKSLRRKSNLQNISIVSEPQETSK